MKRFVRACGASCFSRGASPVWPRPPTVGRWGGFLGVLLSSLFAALAPAARGEDLSAPQALLIDVKGAIGFVSTSQLARALEKAGGEEGSLLIIRLDTPGGLLTSTRDMVQAMLASPIPIVVYVAPSGARAASAGTYLVYASHVAAMAPGTHLGAATPIPLGVPGLPGSPPPSKRSPGSEKPSDPDPASAADRKSVNDAAAYLRTLAELRNRNADWAEKSVREAATLTADEALKERVVDVVARDVDDLLAQIDGRTIGVPAGEVRLRTKGGSLSVLEATMRTKLLSVLADPNVAFVLLLIGIYGILFEFWTPGLV